LVLRVIMLNNNIKILLVSFVHHIELQNFLNAPRSIAQKHQCNLHCIHR